MGENACYFVSAGQARNVRIGGSHEERMLVRILCAAVLVALSQFVCALSANDGKSISFNIPSQRADTALVEFAEQADLTLVFRVEDVRGLNTSGLVGEYSIVEGIGILLAGTGLQPTLKDQLVLSINTVAISTRFQGDEMNNKKKGLLAGLAAILLGTGANAQDVSGTETIEEILVTGSYIARTAGDDASPILNIGQKELSREANTTIADISIHIPSNVGTEVQANIFRQNFSAGTASLNLRGLGLNSTLVLIDGRRVTQSGAYGQDGSSFVDLNSFPAIMLDRVEVLEDGASATYGSDAVAGVGNFITRKTFEGAEVRVSYAKTSDGPQDDFDVGFVVGRKFENTDVVFGLNYFQRDSLRAADRAFTDPDVFGVGFSAAGQPGNFVVSDLPGLTPDPNCEASGGFLRGGLCRFNYIVFNELFVPETRLQSMLNVTHDVSDNTELYGSLLVTRNTVDDQIIPPSLPTVIAGSPANPAIPASHPDNPFDADVIVAIARPFGANSTPGIINRDNNTTRFVFGAKGDIGGGAWSYDVAYQYSKNEYSFNYPDVLRSRLEAAYLGAGGPNNDETFNPFGLSNNNSATVIDDIRCDCVVDSEADLHTLDFVASAEFGNLAGGAIGFAFGAQFRKESLAVDYSKDFESFDLTFLVGASDYSTERDVSAVFAEVLFPLTDSFEATVAVRYENYEGFGSTVDPKLALRWQANDFVVFRGSVSTAFRTPTLLQAFGNFAAVNDFLDSSGAFQFRADLTSGNPDLKNEEADVFNIGVVLTPTENLDIGLDYWSFDYSDVITKENANTVLLAAGGPGNCAAPMPSPDLICNGTAFIATRTDFFNAATLETNGIDLSVRYSRETNVGLFGIDADLTRILTFDIQESATSPTLDVLGRRNFFTFARSNQKVRGSATFYWEGEHHGANVVVRHIGGYVNDGIPVTAEIDSHTTVDLQYTYSVDNIGLSITVGVANVFDEDPPLVATNFNYDTQTHDPRGRIPYVRLSKNFDF